MEFSTTTLSLIAITFIVALTGVYLIGTFGIIQDADAKVALLAVLDLTRVKDVVFSLSLDHTKYLQYCLC